MEGPSLLILKEELKPFKKQKVLAVSDNTKQPKDLLVGRTLSKVDTWAKNLFLSFKSEKDTILTKTHFLMFGSYRINEPRPERTPRLEIKFPNGVLYLYACSVKFSADEYLASVDREVDLMSKKWNVEHVVEMMEKKKKLPLCDLLLDQRVFAGSGNIVKNEVLFNLRIHPLTPLSRIPKKDWPRIATAVHDYMWKFYKWKKQFMLRRHWQVMRQRDCPLCGEKLVKKNLGKNERRTFFCAKHQPLPKKKTSLRVHQVLPLRALKKGPAVKEARLDH